VRCTVLCLWIVFVGIFCFSCICHFHTKPPPNISAVVFVVCYSPLCSSSQYCWCEEIEHIRCHCSRRWHGDAVVYEFWDTHTTGHVVSVLPSQSTCLQLAYGHRFILPSLYFIFMCWRFNSRISFLLFTARRNYASAVLGIVILSVCPSVCHTRALWQNQTIHCGYFATTRNGNYSSFLTPTAVGGRCPLPSEICDQNDPPLRKTPTLTDFRL